MPTVALLAIGALTWANNSTIRTLSTPAEPGSDCGATSAVSGPWRDPSAPMVDGCSIRGDRVHPWSAAGNVPETAAATPMPEARKKPVARVLHPMRRR